MLHITIRFPLGVYHAQSSTSAYEPEWPPHPVRAIGALVAAAHSAGRRQAGPAALGEDLALVQRLCEAPPPIIHAPDSAAVGDAGTGDAAIRISGPTRWAPRNYFTTGKGRVPAEVQKVGVALGDRPIHFEWTGLDLNGSEMTRLASLASDVSFVGTTRSPAIMTVDAGTLEPSLEETWLPAPPADRNSSDTVEVRVPDATTIALFDRRHAARRSAKRGIESASAVVAGIRIGRTIPYALASARAQAVHTVDPCWWGEAIVLALDRQQSEVIPKSAAAYLLARAVRVALLGAFDDPGMDGEAPSILRARGADPHCAFVPLADVWHEAASGEIRGVAIILPHARRVDDVGRQRAVLERGLRHLVTGTEEAPRRYVRIPRAGRVLLRLPTPKEAVLRTLREATYRGSESPGGGQYRGACSWVSVTPMVHARWRKPGRETVLEQTALDCRHVGLPAPKSVEPVRGAPYPGAASRPVFDGRVPDRWQECLRGQTEHLRITFPSPVRGPLLLGRARHFGLGLFVPDRVTRRERAAGEPGDAA